MKPVIAMPVTGRSLFRRYMNSRYVRSLRRAGAKVRWFELKDLERDASPITECDGLLLPGGDDINPKLYGQEKSEKCETPSDLRDAAEMNMLRVFLPTKKPILCVCRGVQVLNVFCGGSLHQDIKDAQKVKHSDYPHRKEECHRVDLQPGTMLRELMGSDQIGVNTMHHQAADRVGDRLTVAAISEDGFVEALEITEHPFCLGVQWHPEHLSRNFPLQQKIFDTFVDRCRQA